MLSNEINERLTDISPGSPAGKLLRRYWHPLCPANSLNSRRPLRMIEIMGENIIVYRSRANKYSAFPERCPHRGASLEYGFIEDDCLRCSYHGWLFGPDGICREMPFESRKQPETIRIASYPIIERVGLLFIYMNTQELADFPEWDILNRKDGSHEIQLQDDLECNWFQIQENAADVTHTTYLHSRWFQELEVDDSSGFDRPMLSYGFQPFRYGLLKSWTYRDDSGSPQMGWGNLLVFPNMLRLESEMHWRVPVNKCKTRVFILRFTPSSKNDTCAQPKIINLPQRKSADGMYCMDTFFSQDAMAWETQGAIADRTKENLGASDTGISMFRHMFLGQVDLVLQGRPPTLGRADGRTIIDLREYMGGYLPMSAPPDPTVTRRRAREEIFDHRHRQFEVETQENI
jgi:5,5'-dehydrodivanillate O-demethylase oxygenase subunit